MNLDAFYIGKASVSWASRFIEVVDLDEPRCVLHKKNNGLEASRAKGTRGFIILKGRVSRKTSMSSNGASALSSEF